MVNDLKPLTPDRPGSTPLEVEAEAIQAGTSFFRLFRLPILRGRTFEPSDAPSDVVVGERLAAILWAGEDPIGRTFRSDQQTYRVIGLARELTVATLDDERNKPEFYVTERRGSTTSRMVSLRCAGPCPTQSEVAEGIQRVHPEIRVSPAEFLTNEFDAELVEPRAIARSAASFGLFAIAAVAGGLFGVLSYTVRLRRRDYGIRTALGASPRQLGWSVAREGLAVSGTGVLAGAGFAWMIGRWLSSLQFGITPLDPITWILVPALLGVTALAASWLPAREAARADPLELLRAE